MRSDPRIPSITDLPEPIREEIWGAERLEQHARELAETHRVRPGWRGDRRLSTRVAENGRVLLAAYAGAFSRQPGTTWKMATRLLEDALG